MEEGARPTVPQFHTTGFFFLNVALNISIPIYLLLLFAYQELCALHTEEAQHTYEEWFKQWGCKLRGSLSKKSPLIVGVFADNQVI